MIDQDKVNTETGAHQDMEIEPAVIIGWMPDGKFVAYAPNLDPFRMLALIEKARDRVLAIIKEDKQPAQIAVVPSLPPALRNGGRVN